MTAAGILKAILSSVTLYGVVIGGLVVFGGPTPPKPMDHIAERISALDWAGLPEPETYVARDGESLSLRRYAGGDRIIIALHGSGGAGRALHRMARVLNDAGHMVIVPDIRGHGDSGRRGDVDYIGQPEDDISDLIAMIRAERPGAKITLIGFSMGGGLALRFAAARPEGIEEVILLSPYLAHDAPPATADNPYGTDTPWAAAGVPRIIGLSMLNTVGITALNHLPVVAFATRPEDADSTTPRSTYRLMKSVNHDDWARDLRALEMPLSVLVGAEDELHEAHALIEAVRAAKPGARTEIIPATDHMGLSLDDGALQAVVQVMAGGAR